MHLQIQFPEKREKRTVSMGITDRNSVIHIFTEVPIEVTLLGGRKKSFCYDFVKNDKNKFYAECVADIERGQLRIIDTYEIQQDIIKVDRQVSVLKAEENTAIRLTTQWRGRDKESEGFDDYQFVVPGSFYNKNDTDNDGCDDYLGTFCQDYKDDRNPLLSILEYCTKSNRYVSLIRADLPQKDVTITREQIKQRHFVHETDIGSLGIDMSQYHSQEFILRCDYPFYERASFCLNVDGSEWAAYKQVSQGDVFDMSYLFYTGMAGNLTEAAWKMTSLQMDRILNPEVKLLFTLEDARRCRRELIFNSFREFPDKKGHPAGFFVHFSPRKTYGKQNILEYGFCGQQSLQAHAILSAYKDNCDEEYRTRAVKAIDFLVGNCIEESGLPNAMYNVDKEKFVYWWTGILYPFQYSDDRKTLEGYLGNQLVSSLMPIAEKLKMIEGNYCRTMTDNMYYLFLCFLLEKEYGTVHREWLDAVIKFCNKMLEIQNENGSWNRAYTMEGIALTKPKEWFGASETEWGSGAIFPAALLVSVYNYTKEEKYLKAAERAAIFVRNTYVKDITYIGGLNDTSHIKSVKIDAVGVMFAMRTMISVYEVTKDPELLLGARDAARVLATWTYMWDIPFDSSTTLGKHGFKTTGWAGCDVIPACSYVDDEFVEFIPDLLKVAEYCKDEKLAILAKIVTRGMQHGLSMPQNMYGYAMPGVQCEGYMTSLWLADTEYTDFSGASAKNKGDDNDTCNGLVNGQALYNLDYIMNKYHTFDFDQIIGQIIR